MTRPDTRPSLRTELLVNFALLAAAALVFAVGSGPPALRSGGPGARRAHDQRLVAADVIVLTVFGAYQIHRLLVRPLRETAAAAEAIAAGDLRRTRRPTRIARAESARGEREPHDGAPARGAGASGARREARERRTARGRHRARDRKSAGRAQWLQPHPARARRWRRARARGGDGLRARDDAHRSHRARTARLRAPKAARHRRRSTSTSRSATSPTC